MACPACQRALRALRTLRANTPYVSYVPTTARKESKYGVISGPYFPVFGLNLEIYFVNIRIQSEYRKIRTRNNSVFGHFSRSTSAQVYFTDRKIKDIDLNEIK